MQFTICHQPISCTVCRRMNCEGNMPIMAVSNKIIIERLEKQADDDIIVPDGAGVRKQEKGTVVSVGPGRLRNDGSMSVPMTVIGDVVYYNPFGCTALEHDNKEYLVLTEEDILAIVKGE